MFKAFVSKSHPEFSSNRQQDAQEFFLHLVNLVEVSKSVFRNAQKVVRRVPSAWGQSPLVVPSAGAGMPIPSPFPESVTVPAGAASA